MISQSGKKILEKFVTSAKELLMKNITNLLQEHYGIWANGHTVPVEQLADQDTDIVHTARMLRERLVHLLSALPNGTNKEKLAVEQLIAEQAFTQLNRFAAVRMCEERDLILETIRQKYQSGGFMAYDSIANSIPESTFTRYKWYLLSVFDELSVELPAVFDRFSPYGLVFPDETTLLQLLDLINDPQLSAWYDEQTGETVNFWREDETLGWMFQDYNSLEERRKMREESNKPRNSREMAVRNQFFTPEYVVRFLTDNSLGRIWYEMTQGQSRIGEEQCAYMVRRPSEVLAERKLKEPTEILSLDPTCGSMHFGLYLYEVYEYIYMDAWDNQPTLLHEFRARYTRDSFQQEVPRLILEKNIYGCEIDARALQIAALSLWLRAQRSYSDQNIPADQRPLIKRSHLVLAEAMPGNQRLLKGLMDELDKPMQRLLTKIWEKMKFVGEAGLLFKMEKEIAEDIEYLKKNWSKITYTKNANLFSTEEEKEQIYKEEEANKLLRENKEAFFAEISDRLQTALATLTEKMSEEEGYENALFSEDATRGLAFIELCQKRFDCIVMNPPFGEGSENTSKYLDDNYTAWCRNLVCAFFDRMQEMLVDDGRLGAIFDRTVLIKTSYEDFRKKCACGFILTCADTGEGVLDANVETSTLVIQKHSSDVKGFFVNVLKTDVPLKNQSIKCAIEAVLNGEIPNNVYFNNSIDFLNLPNAIIGYYFKEFTLDYFKKSNMEERNLISKKGHDLAANIYPRMFYELTDTKNFSLLYNGGSFTMFYFPYADAVFWNEEIIRSNSLCNLRSLHLQQQGTVGYGKRGEILDAHALKKGFIFTAEGIGIPNLKNEDGYACISYLNSICAQNAINLYCGQHKGNGYVNILPMPDYDSRQSDIESIVNEIIDIKRKWFSLDETNLEYRGLIGGNGVKFDNIGIGIQYLGSELEKDKARYDELVKENDDLWMDLAGIEENSEFRQTLNEYKKRRPYEELLSINGASTNNVVNEKVIAQEIIQELVGITFGRWDIRYAQGKKDIPAFGDVFDALPFMPEVSLKNEDNTDEYNSSVLIPKDGILTNEPFSPDSLTNAVQTVMHHIWHNADDVEYDLCKLIGTPSLQSYFENMGANGFFDYHFKRYTKSRRKAPIYWPLCTKDGKTTYWVYYPKMDKNTLPQLIIRLREQDERLRSQLDAALAAHNKVQENELLIRMEQLHDMMDELNRIIALGYEPNHDDGVPVTSAPLFNLISHRSWHNECEENWKLLEKGNYDWSHLSMILYPARITTKAKKDWCMALTHGLEHICENKPRKKKATKSGNVEEQLEMAFD